MRKPGLQAGMAKAKPNQRGRILQREERSGIDRSARAAGVIRDPWQSGCGMRRGQRHCPVHTAPNVPDSRELQKGTREVSTDAGGAAQEHSWVKIEAKGLLMKTVRLRFLGF